MTNPDDDRELADLEITMHMGMAALIGHQTVAQPYHLEAWGLFDTGGVYGHPVLELQVLDTIDDVECDDDEDPVQRNEGALARIVIARALDGSALHQQLMQFLYWHSAQEWRRICALHVFDEEYDVDLPDVAKRWITAGRALDGFPADFDPPWPDLLAS